MGDSYCIEEDWGFPQSSTTTSSSTTATSTSTSTGNGVTTPLPIQTGMVTTCDKFYLVASGDTCSSVVSNYDITLTQFYIWNPAVGSSCSYLDVGDYVCVGATGNTTTTPTTSGNGITTPTPIQTGMASNCNKFYLVASGDTCSAISTTYGISLASFYSWNPAVGSSCSYLDVGDYVCVGVMGNSTTTTTSITTGNGITTPTPIQTGIASNCDRFYLVASGDTCSAVAATYGISLATFYAWNPAVGSSCSYLDIGDYVCVGIVGQTTSSTATRTTFSTTTTKTTGNGVSTPTPTQPGMVSNCDKFHYGMFPSVLTADNSNLHCANASCFRIVVTGDTCAGIASAAGITVAQFETWNAGVGSTCGNMWLNAYVCIGIL